MCNLRHGPATARIMAFAAEAAQAEQLNNIDVPHILAGLSKWCGERGIGDQKIKSLAADISAKYPKPEQDKPANPRTGPWRGVL